MAFRTDPVGSLNVPCCFEKLKTKAIIITGSSSAGKTTLAKALQEALLPDIWLHFSFDTLVYSLPQSVLERCNSKDDWSGVDGALLYQSSISCLQSLITSGNCVIFDAVLPNEKKAKELLSALDGVDILTVGLHCRWEEIESRTISRGDRSMAEAKRSFETASDFIKSQLVFDTSEMSPSDVAGEILAVIGAQEN